jgi:oxepin-CoA hydrolase/3-oxo-5,6-dehydrosuberyl-CoA semialdehyde dehydrogenase
MSQTGHPTVTTVPSFIAGHWQTGRGEGALVLGAVYGEPVARISVEGLELGAAFDYARRESGPRLRQLTLHERARLLKRVAQHLMAVKEAFYELSYASGTTRADAWIDIEGGIGTLFSYSSLARRELPDERFWVEDQPISLAKDGTFVAQHLLTPKEGVALHINAYNFPCWGMLEKFAPTFLAGVPAIVKPAPQTAYLAEAVVREMLPLLPEGSLQLVSGGDVDLLGFVREQDAVTFTGSAETGQKLKGHPNVLARNVPFTLEADSLNCCILGESVTPEAEEFGLFVREVVREMTAKAGQKCTAIRRVLVPEGQLEAVQEALATRLAKTVVGDPKREGVRMGPLVSTEQREAVRATVARLKGSCAVAWEAEQLQLEGGDAAKGGFFPPTLLRCDAPLEAREPHELEPFGPVSTLLPYRNLAEACEIARLGRGSLVSSVVTNDPDEARALVFGLAPLHGRVLVLNRNNAKSSTGHGSPLPQLTHGGPGRAGGGEELGGVRAIKRFMQRTAVQADPSTLMALTNAYVPGAKTHQTPIHPFRKTFDELTVGESYTTRRRTVTEADIVLFAALSGDHFYAHTDELAAKDSLFGKRVAHGYFLIAAAAGLFVDPAPGPVLANYGLENLRFITPVGIGDTIQATLTVKQKTARERREGEARATGVVAWDVMIHNQLDETVARYTVLTLVARKGAL